MKTALMLAVVLLGVGVFWFSFTAALRTEYPLHAVVSGSMFPTVRVGDQLLVQGVQDASEIHADAENGDIIVFRKPINPSEFIVHRAVAKVFRGDTWLLTTKGDYNSGSLSWEKNFEESYVIGKVVSPTIPLFGYLKIFLGNMGGIAVYVVLMLTILFADYVPLQKKTNTDPSSKQKVLKLFLYVLAALTFIPFATSFMRVDSGLLYQTEIIAVMLWYAACFTIPLVVNEVDTTLVLWCFTFIFVGIMVGSDVVYHATGIDPVAWYDSLGRLTYWYYSFMKTWVLVVVPGCIFFFIALFKSKSFVRN